ncbi:MAG: cardiolipin synthase [Desulfobacterales bacterium]|jgi:cardiolipin synthase
MTAFLADHLTLVVGLLGGLLYLGAIGMALDAVMQNRTAQGAIAWAVSLITFPFAAFPLYLIFGRNKFYGYVAARRSDNRDLKPIVDRLAGFGPAVQASMSSGRENWRALEMLALMPFTHSNHARLLIDGKNTFEALFAGIDSARHYILAFYYIIKDDDIGREFQARLIARAKSGVRVYLLYDEIGSFSLPGAYLEALREAGVHVRPFHSTKGKANRFQLNFRNHRKIVVVDGRTAFVGGLNVGDEYLKGTPKLGKWRDTHLQMEGPSVQCTQLVFLEDWYWATHQIPDLDWEPKPAPDRDQDILVLPTGPADELESCGLFFLETINGARERLWVASPYFVPDRQIVSALQLAALRGVDVRLILPQKADHLLVYLSSFSYLEEAEKAGVKIYRYQPGFLHHKVLLVDDELAAVGTANLDNRSFRLNFEITVVVNDRGFAGEVEAMLREDLARCRQTHPRDLTERRFWFRLAVRVSRLLAPVQ